MDDNQFENNEPLKRRRTDIPPRSKVLRYLRQDVSRRTILITLLVYICLSFFYYSTIKPPVLFPSRNIITLNSGMSLKEASEYLYEKNLIRSPLWLRNLVILYSGEKSVIAGDYYFEQPANIFAVVKRITDKNYQMEPLRITIPEGLNNREVAETYSGLLNRFNKEVFLEAALKKEGYLFPDTYFFLPTASEETVLQTMMDNFKYQTDKIFADRKDSSRSIEEIVIMASILELEGNDRESRQVISGILWRRIALGMPLQVDASFAYLMNKGTSEITQEDLLINSPYNTYKYKGLPPTPIANPGLESIEAALEPKKTSYLYYLSDKEGNMYYAKDFEAHKKNKQLYLD